MTRAAIGIAFCQLILSATYAYVGEPITSLNIMVGACGWALLWHHERKRFSNEPPF